MNLTLSSLTPELRAEWRNVKWIVLGIVAYVVLGAAYVMVHGEFSLATYGIYARKLALFYFVSLPLASLFLLLVTCMIRSPGNPTLYLRAHCVPRSVARFLVGYALLLVMIPFWATFTQVKLTLAVSGFSYDVVLANHEQWLHGGVMPSNWLATQGAEPWLLRAVEVNYNVLWQVYHVLFLSYIVVHPAAQRVRVFYCAFYCVSWVILGNLMAGVWISAGPAFYALVTEDASRFAPLMALLDSGKEHLHSAYRFQEYLWNADVQGKAALGTGISAFPSVHIFIVTCNALFIYHYFSRRIGLVAFAYALFVLISSAYLGWHYLIDGYASILYAAVGFVVLSRIKAFSSLSGSV
jgi:hypothetical protein